jgi:hypothetical protein
MHYRHVLTLRPDDMMLVFSIDPIIRDLIYFSKVFGCRQRPQIDVELEAEPGTDESDDEDVTGFSRVRLVSAPGLKRLKVQKGNYDNLDIILRPLGAAPSDRALTRKDSSRVIWDAIIRCMIERWEKRKKRRKKLLFRNKACFTGNRLFAEDQQILNSEVLEQFEEHFEAVRTDVFMYVESLLSYIHLKYFS